ncbi:MAG: V-type ATP synthase subunit E [Bacteroidota bacterium]
MGEAKAMVESILDLAKNEADAILASARAKGEDIMAKARRELAAKVAALEAETERRAAVEARRITTRSELDSRTELLRAKVELLDEVFAGAYRALLELPEAEWRTLIRRLLLAQSTTGAEEIVIPPGQEQRFAALLPEVNGELKKAGKRGDLRLARDSAPIEGGFILSGPDYSVDCSFRTLIAERRPLYEPEVAKVLFGDK